jgi:rubrerythrin
MAFDDTVIGKKHIWITLDPENTPATDRPNHVEVVFRKVYDELRRKYNALTSGWWVCPECGPQRYTEEDGSCLTCGRDCYDPKVVKDE